MVIDGVRLAGLTIGFVLLFVLFSMGIVWLGGYAFSPGDVVAYAGAYGTFHRCVAPTLAAVLSGMVVARCVWRLLAKEQERIASLRRVTRPGG